MQIDDCTRKKDNKLTDNKLFWKNVKPFPSNMIIGKSKTCSIK